LAQSKQIERESIEKHLSIKKQRATNLLGDMKALSLISEQVPEHDKRKREYTLSQYGLERCAELNIDIEWQEENEHHEADYKAQIMKASQQAHEVIRSSANNLLNAQPEVLIFYEQKLVNVICRIGFAATPTIAQTMIERGLILVNGKASSPCYVVKEQDEVKLPIDNAPKVTAIQAELAMQAGQPNWLQVDTNNMVGVCTGQPESTDFHVDTNHLLAGQYSAALQN
jgi:ribosomal protein S4